MQYDSYPVEREGERNIWCQYYEECLDYVANEFWGCWDCSSCKHRSNREGRMEVALRESNQSDYYELADTLDVL